MELRRHVPALTAVLSVAALTVVFAAARQAIPPWLLPAAPGWLLAAIPPFNAAISAVAIVTITVGWRAIRRGNVRRHRRAMLTSVALFVTFLVAYLYRVASKGPTRFDGPPVFEQFVYLPLLAIHILLAVVCVPLLIYVLLLAATHPVAELPETNHPRVGRVAAALWLVSFALGIVVFAMLYVLY